MYQNAFAFGQTCATSGTQRMCAIETLVGPQLRRWRRGWKCNFFPRYSMKSGWKNTSLEYTNSIGMTSSKTAQSKWGKKKRPQLSNKSSRRATDTRIVACTSSISITQSRKSTMQWEANVHGKWLKATV